MKNSIYVDDLVAGAADKESAIDIFQAARKIMLATDMNLRNWKSNPGLGINKMEASMALTKGHRKSIIGMVL